MILFVATLHQQVSEVSTSQLITETLILSVPYVTGASADFHLVGCITAITFTSLIKPL